jgi:hypothetical protein
MYWQIENTILNVEPNSENSINDFQNLVSFGHNHLSNPFFSYYNINSLRNKFFEIKDLASKVLPDILVLAETKIDSDFKDSEFI